MSLKVYSFLYFLIITLSRLHVCLSFISVCYPSDTECLDESASYLNVCDQKIGRRYEFKSIDTICSSVKGRLLERALLDWSVIDAPQFTIEVTEFGHRLPFNYIPTPKILNNNRSALAEAPFVKEAIQILLELNCVAELSVPPEIVNALYRYLFKRVVRKGLF